MVDNEDNGGSAKKRKFFSSAIVYNRCCNPMNLVNHNRTKSLRTLTKEISDLYSHLDPKQMICSSCRKTITQKFLAPIKNAEQSVESSSST